MKFRKKPVIVDAYQTDIDIIIDTLEGEMHASPGDWIITGVNGECYPCKPDIFEKTYEVMEEKIRTKSNKFLREDDVVKAVDKNTDDSGRLKDDITCILESIDKIQIMGDEYRKSSKDKELLLDTIRTVRMGCEITDMLLANTIKNENGEESNMLPFSDIKSFAEYFKVMNFINMEFIDESLTKLNE